MSPWKRNILAPKSSIFRVSRWIFLGSKLFQDLKPTSRSCCRPLGGTPWWWPSCSPEPPRPQAPQARLGDITGDCEAREGAKPWRWKWKPISFNQFLGRRAIWFLGSKKDEFSIKIPDININMYIYIYVYKYIYEGCVLEEPSDSLG